MAGHAGDQRRLAASEFSDASAREQHGRELIEDLDAIVWEADARTWQFTYVSQQAEKLLGHPISSWLNNPQFWVSLLHPLDRDSAIRHFTECTARGEPHSFEYRAVAADGHVVWLHNAVHAVQGSNGAAAKLRGVMVDVTARKWSELAMEGHRRTLELIAHGETLEEILVSLCRAIEDQSVHHAIASILLLEGDRLRHGAAPSLPASYRVAIDGIVIGPAAGSCGTAAYRREPVAVADIAASPLWNNQREIALSHGLRSCWSTPIFSRDGQVLGTFAIYYRDAQQPPASDLTMVATMSRAAAIAIERDQGRRALREADMQVASILNRITDGFVAFDRQWRITYLNRQAADLITRRGVPAEQVLGKVVWEIFPDLAETALHREYEAAMRQQRPVVLDFYYDSLGIWLEHRAYPSQDGLTVYFQDITQRRQHQRTLRETEERFRTTFEQAAVGVAHVGLDGRWLRVNQRLCDIVGYTREEMLRLRFQDITHPDDLATDVANLRAACEGRLDSFTREKRYIRKDGSTSWISLTVSVARDDAAAPSYFISVIQDISRRKNAEHQLEERARQQRQLYQLTDAMNRAGALEAIYDAALDAILVSLIADRASILLFDDDDVMRFKAWRGLSQEYRRAVEGHSPWKRDTQQPEPICIADIRQAEIDRPLQQTIIGEGIAAMSFIPLVYQQRLLGKFMVYYDTPHEFSSHEVELARTIATQLAFAIERKRTEADLREAKEQAEAANRAKDRFLAVLSHELRTPLTPVVMTVAAMEQAPTLPQELRDDLAMVRRNIDLETKLIDDLLDLSRVATGKLRLQLESLDVHAILRHVLGSCETEADMKKLAISIDCAAENALVTGDAARLQQVFWNLLKNAIKFTPAGGRISIRTANIDNHLRVQFADSGVGIAPAVLPRLFNAFEQGDGQLPRQFGGLGLGLAIAKTVVDLHHGRIGATSPGDGMGSVFTVELPSIDPQQQQSSHTPSVPAENAPAPRCRILLVEDHPDSCRTLSRLLSRCGYEVQTANSAAAALQQAADHSFDLVISDIGLPDASGYELMARLKREHQLRGIALSGYGMEADIRRSREAGFSDHVVKPVNVAQLQTAIQRALRSEPA